MRLLIIVATMARATWSSPSFPSVDDDDDDDDDEEEEEDDVV
jgi:hypothetical protein